MSASPADRTPGRTPNGSLPPLIRRPKPADPLVRKKPRSKRPPVAQPNGVNGAHANSLLAPRSKGRPQDHAPHRVRVPTSTPPVLPPSIHEASEAANSGFTSAPIAPYTDYPLVMTKRALKEEIRLHVARFASKKNIDPSNEIEFTRPVRLHRRDPRAPPAGGENKDEDMLNNGTDSKLGVLEDSKEKEIQEMLRAEREARREAEMAQVAPAANTGGQKRLGAFKKKTQQVFRNDQTEEQKMVSKVRYEEALPWHLEDFDNKHTWVGSYEAALSETYCMLVKGQDGVFRMTPLDKWYKFTPKQQFKILTIEEAESHMNRKVKDPRWVMETHINKEKQKEEQMNKKMTSGLYIGKTMNTSESKGPSGGVVKEEDDHLELDFEEDFADDEEGRVLEGDEDEAKHAEERIRKDQLQANVFDLKSEKTYENAESLEKALKDAGKQFGKKTQKVLIKREKNYVYDVDSDSNNPYAEESESEDSEEERLKEEQRKKEEEEKKVGSEKDKLKPPQPSSGTSTKGTSTPSGHPPRPHNPNHRSSSTSLKRPGSPNLSEASGNESSRKKHKIKHPSNLQPGTGTSTPNGPPSRPRSPAFPPNSSVPAPGSQRKASTIRLNVSTDKLENKRARIAGVGGGSDGEAASGGEMSDGSRKRIKLHVGKPESQVGSPQPSRAGSPTAAGPDPRSRPVSPDHAPPFPTPAEVKAHIPSEGTTISELLKVFKKAIVGKERGTRFTEMLRTVSRYDKGSKILFPN